MRWGVPDMGVISWAVLGFIAGLVSSRIIDKQGEDFPLNVTLAIVGAVMGGLLFDLFGASGIATMSFWNTLVAIARSRTLCC
jgi:uncharacterized membrane protein YeaQ/YmgE (transglycosylase-associated protein family)